MLQKYFRIVFVTLVLGLSALFFVACANPTPTPMPTVDINNLAAAERISLQDAKAHFDAGTAIFLDVRPENSYARSHVTGAMHIVLEEVDARFKEIPQDQLIITYCT
jgi:hypothetical protein